jgi:hypothetical protein
MQLQSPTPAGMLRNATALCNLAHKCLKTISFFLRRSSDALWLSAMEG